MPSAITTSSTMSGLEQKSGSGNVELGRDGVGDKCGLHGEALEEGEDLRKRLPHRRQLARVRHEIVDDGEAFLRMVTIQLDVIVDNRHRRSRHTAALLDVREERGAD